MLVFWSLVFKLPLLSWLHNKLQISLLFPAFWCFKTKLFLVVVWVPFSGWNSWCSKRFHTKGRWMMPSSFILNNWLIHSGWENHCVSISLMTRSTKAVTPTLVFGITKLQQNMSSVFSTCFLQSYSANQVRKGYESAVTSHAPELWCRRKVKVIALWYHFDSEGQSSLPS